MIICRWPKAKVYYPPLPQNHQKKKETKEERKEQGGIINYQLN
jgi:hypothetical protein